MGRRPPGRRPLSQRPSLTLAVLVPALNSPGGLPMADLPRAIHIDARTIVDRVRAEAGRSDVPRGWLPQGTFDDLLEESDRDPIHFHEAIHHLHHNWDRGPALSVRGAGRGP